jgi:hypothetical protein
MLPSLKTKLKPLAIAGASLSLSALLPPKYNPWWGPVRAIDINSPPEPEDSDEDGMVAGLRTALADKSKEITAQVDAQRENQNERPVLIAEEKNTQWSVKQAFQKCGPLEMWADKYSEVDLLNWGINKPGKKAVKAAYHGDPIYNEAEIVYEWWGLNRQFEDGIIPMRSCSVHLEFRN